MWFPSHLFGTGVKALSGSLVELVTHRTALAAGALASLQQNGPAVPLDYIELIHHIGVEWTAGGAQFMETVACHDASDAGQLHAIVYANGPAHSMGSNVAQITGTAFTDFNVRYVLGPGRFLRWNVSFNSGALANNFRGFYQAWRIPRGEISVIGP